MGGTSSITMEKQRDSYSNDQNPQNGIVPQNPQSAELGFVKPQSVGNETTPVSSSDPSSSVIDAELKRNQPQMMPVASKEGSGVGDRIGYQNGLDEDGNFRRTLDEEIHQVIYKEALNEAVMNLALVEDRNGPREEESPFFDSYRAVEVGKEGNNEGRNGPREEESPFFDSYRAVEVGKEGNNEGRNGPREEESPFFDSYRAVEVGKEGNNVGRNGPREEESPFFDSYRAVEVGKKGNNDEVEVGFQRGVNGEEVWEWESDVKRGKNGNVDEIQGQNGNDDAGSEEEGEENYGTEEASGYGGNRNYNRRFQYPLRLEAEDCSFYMKTGSCKFGMNCKFNHPPKRRNQGTKDKAKPRAEDSERLGQIECKYYLTSAGCKYGNACKYSHSKEKSAVAPIVEFNFLGLPIRLGERECPFYMRTGSCKYGLNCRFNHPDPTSVAGSDLILGYGNGGPAQLHGAAQTTASSWSSASTMFPPTQGMPSNSEWNGYQATVYPTSERSLPTPPAFAMNNPATETNFYAPHQQQMPVDEFPQRPGQLDCSYFLKTGDCKYKANCRFNHPKVPSSKPTSSCALSDKGLPLRPDQSICSFYNRYGICKFGPGCKFDHPENWGKSVASDGVRMGRNEMEKGFS